MIICFPFVYMDNWYWKRYKEQLISLANEAGGLFIPVEFGLYPDEIDNYKNIFMHIRKNLKEKNVIRMRNKRHPITRNIANAYFYSIKIPKVYKMAKEISSYDYDVVLGYSGAGWQQLYHILLAQNKGVKAIYRMRGYGKLERSISNSFINKFFNNTIEDISWKKYDYFIPITHEFKNILIHYGVNRNIINNPIALGVDTNMFYKTNEPDEIVIGYFGRISHEKGIKFLTRLMKKTPDIKYIVCGKSFINFNFPNNVDYIGVIHKDKMNEKYNAVNAVILPSLSEGLSNNIYEAYATGRIIIGSQNAINKMFPVYGYKMNDYNMEKWVKVINNLSNIDINQIGSKARKWACKNDWNSFGINMVKVLKKVM